MLIARYCGERVGDTSTGQHDGIDITRFYRFDGLTELLQGLERDYPHLASLQSISTSYERRDIWSLLVTNHETAAADDKSAIYIDGNIHAGEVTGCNVALHTAYMLLCEYGNDPEITAPLDIRAFHIAPHVQPDGAELYLTTPLTLRPSVRP